MNSIEPLSYEASAETQPSPTLSFVIPAFNESKNIVRALASIHRQAAEYSHEVIVVDNGSSDATARLAREAGATVLIQPGGTIAMLRNLGARHACGRELVFIDADVSLSDNWRASLPATLAMLDRDTARITGSRCRPPDDCGWIERYWFLEIAAEKDAGYLGTGHMLLRRELFWDLGGFDEDLETGEDYEFCQRARAGGAAIVNNPQLQVVHHDFPRSLTEFIRREAWHGRGDLRSIRAFLQSKVAVAAAVFLSAHLLLLTGLLVAGGGKAILMGLSLILLLLLASTWKKYRHACWRAQLVNTGLYYFYYLGRSGAFLHLLQRRRTGRAPRAA